MAECSKCGASAPGAGEGDVCLYCGSTEFYQQKPRGLFADAPSALTSVLQGSAPVTNSVRPPPRVSPLDALVDSFAVLHRMPAPQASSTLVKVLWWYLAIGTFGISCLFWRYRTLNKFDWSRYDQAVKKLRFQLRNAEQFCSPEERPKLQFIREEANQIELHAAQVRAKRKWVWAAVVAVLVALAVVGSFIEDEDEKPKDKTTAVAKD